MLKMKEKIQKEMQRNTSDFCPYTILFYEGLYPLTYPKKVNTVYPIIVKTKECFAPARMLPSAILPTAKPANTPWIIIIQKNISGSTVPISDCPSSNLKAGIRNEDIPIITPKNMKKMT